eukprot:3127775-Karenia_brevis.AAC.1
MGASPARLLDNMKTLAETLATTFRKFALKVNWKPGKTEAMIVLRGTNSVKVRERLRNMGNKIALSETAGCNELRFVD